LVSRSQNTARAGSKDSRFIDKNSQSPAVGSKTSLLTGEAILAENQEVRSPTLPPALALPTCHHTLRLRATRISLSMRLNLFPPTALLCIVGLCTPFSAAEPALEPSEFFEKQVRPVLLEQCAECHGPDVS